MKTEKFNYDLPEHLIAQYPSSKRTNSKLLVALESIQHQVFKDIGNHLNKGDLLILNKTSVIPARLFGEKVTGGKIELLLERFLSNQQTLTQIRSSRTPKEGAELVFSFQGQRFLATVEGRQDNFFILNWSDDPKSLFEQYGQIPLPPYMNRAAEKLDEERYETIYADPDQKASVAAPTAGMHFDQELLHIEDHVIHKELVEVDASLIDQVKRVKASNGKIIAVGTTSVRAIETAFQDEPSAFKGETSLFIYPGYKFKVVDHMITNFHLPKSSLLMLVAAFIGYEKMMTIYETAIEQEYRFLSYGDAMLLKYHEI